MQGAKASRLYKGRPLFEYGWGLLGNLCKRRVWLGDCPDVVPPSGALCLDDPGQGPLGAILAALNESSTPWNLILAVDYPELTLEILKTLPLRTGALAVLPRAAGQPHPLCGYYHRDLAGSLQRCWEQGERSVLRALEGVDWVDFSDSSGFCNVNQPSDLKQASDRH